MALSPGHIASLTGNLSLKAASYFAVGSDLSARKNLSVDVGGALTLVEVADTLQNHDVTDVGSTTVTTTVNNDHQVGTATDYYSCSWWGWSRCSYTYAVNNTWTAVTTGTTSTDQQIVSNTTSTIVQSADLIGRDVTLKAGSFNAPGSKILAQNSLSLTTTASLTLDAGTSKSGGIVDQDTQYTGWDVLPAGTITGKISVLDLGSDAVAAITSKVSAEDYLSFLNDQTHMQAVQALHNTSASALRQVARSVGVQKWQSSAAGAQFVDASSITEGQHSFVEALNANFAARALPPGLTQVALLGKSDWADVLSGEALNSAATKIETDILGTNWNVAARKVVGNDELVRALGWRYAARDALKQLGASVNTVLYSGGDLALTSGGDIGIKGGTVVAAGNNLRLDAGQDIVLLGVNGTGIVPNRANAGYYAADSVFLNSSALARASVTSGGDMTLAAKRDIWNVGSTLTSAGSLIASAEGDIRNQAIGTYFVQTAATGCQNAACGANGITFTPAEMLSGAGLVLTAKTDIVNRGSIMSAAGSVLLASEHDIVNDSRFGSYESNSLDIEDRPWWLFGGCRQCVHTHEFTGVVQGGDISTLLGDITLQAKNDVRNVGSRLAADGGRCHRAVGGAGCPDRRADGASQQPEQAVGLLGLVLLRLRKDLLEQLHHPVVAARRRHDIRQRQAQPDRHRRDADRADRPRALGRRYGQLRCRAEPEVSQPVGLEFWLGVQGLGHPGDAGDQGRAGRVCAICQHQSDAGGGASACHGQVARHQRVA